MMKLQNKKIRNDILLVAALLLIAALGGIYLFVFRPQGDTVSITVNGKPYAVYALSENICHDIRTGENEEQYNRLIISDGKAYVQTASCPDGICASHRPIFRDGESIICLPHQVVITVTAAKTQDTPDIIA